MQKKFQLLQKLGEAALLPYKKGNGVWVKPQISARYQAVMRKELQKEGGEWPLPPAEAKKSPFDRKPKGHKFEKEKIARDIRVAQNMEDMPKKIAEYRERKKRQYTFFDQLTMTPKQLRAKYRDQK